jgi:hypothetical protein
MWFVLRFLYDNVNGLRYFIDEILDENKHEEHLNQR